MTLHSKIETEIFLRNNSPVDDFFGLSPNQFHHLLYNTFEENSPVQFHNIIAEETFDEIPLFRIMEEYLKIIQRDGHLKLTPLGALQKKVVVELYSKKFLREELIEMGISKLSKESDSTTIRSARLSAELAGLVRKANGKLTLTKNAEKLLKSNDRLQIFKLFLQAFTEKFNWSFNDGYPDSPVGARGLAFSLMMLEKFGDQPAATSFYAERCLKAFPMLLAFFHSDFQTPEQQFHTCYSLRTFERFFEWFGFVTVHGKKSYFDRDSVKYQKTDLVGKLFKMEDI